MASARDSKWQFPATGQLTAREKQVLALIARGRTSKEIARDLGIAFRTVVCHRYRTQQKLGARNTADRTRAAIRMGLLTVTSYSSEPLNSDSKAGFQPEAR